jgi:DNA repair exonuclease SbcCD nuclease subunit
MKNKIPLCGVITDTHTKDNNISFVEGIFYQFTTYLQNKNIKTAVHSGDWFDDRFTTSLNSLLSVKSIIKTIDSKEIELFTISGNHEKCDYLTGSSYLNVIEDCSKSLKLYTYPGFYNHPEHKDIRFAFLSFFKEGEAYLGYLLELIEMIKKDDKKNGKRKTILFTHTSITGAKNNDGTKVENDLEQEFFDFFDLVIVGHYHNRNSLNSKIHYIGSAYSANFGEDDRKGFAIIYSDLSIEYIQTEFPKYKKIVINATDKKQLSEVLQQNQNSKDNVRIVLKGSQADLDAVDVVSIKNAGIDIKCENTVELLVNFQEIEDAEIQIFDKESILKGWIQYSSGISLTSAQRKKGLDALKEM